MRFLPRGMDDKRMKAAFAVVILFGLVSLFGDIIYEGARGVNGPYLESLGASAAIVGLIAGLGEFLGYAVRLASGYFSDRTRSYWIFTMVGYGLLLTVPMLALTGYWQTAGFFIVLERFGKGIRSPAKDTILSSATKKVGTGFGFGLSEAMDQIGAIIGPMMFAILFFVVGGETTTIRDYRIGYALLIVPFVFMIACLFMAYRRIPDPEAFEREMNPEKKTGGKDHLDRTYWLYVLFSATTTIGFVSFALIGFHLKATGVVADWAIPFLYAVAMGIDGAFALVIGKIYDHLKEDKKDERAGLLTLILIPLFSIIVPISFLTGSLIFPIIGIIAWGIVMGAQETIMKSTIADITPLRKRGTGYGVLNTAIGFSFLIGGISFGVLYEVDPILIFVGVLVIQLFAIPAFMILRKNALSKG